MPKLTLPQLNGDILLRLALLLVLAILGTYALKMYVLDAPFRRAVSEAGQQQATHYAHLIDSAVQEQVQRIEQLAQEVGNRNLDPTTFTAWADSFRARHPDFFALLLKATGDDIDSLDNDFVARHQIDKVLAGEIPPPQAARIDQWALYIARPVAIAGQTTPIALLAKLDPYNFLNQIISTEPPGGHLRLLQSVSNLPTATLFEHGAGLATEAESATALVTPNWELRYQPGPELLARVPRNTLLFAALTAILWLAVIFASKKSIAIAQLPAKTHGKIKDNVPDPDPLLAITEKKPIPETTDRPTPLPITQPPSPEAEPPPTHVFRDYDIRGRAEVEITEAFAHRLGRVLGAMMLDRGQATMVVARDGRLSSPALSKALIFGITSTGCHALDLGLAPTPVLNHALNTLDNVRSGVMVTASHNPPGDNGFKIMVDQHVLRSEEIQSLRTQMSADDLPVGQGEVHEYRSINNYINAICQQLLPPSGLKVVIDCCNGATAVVAPALFRKLNCDLVELHCQVDGNFPNHAPDPTVSANLKDLIDQVRNQDAAVGFAFDGDGDRVVAVSSSGRIVWPDELLMIFARDILSRSPGTDVVFDVKSTRRLPQLISSYGGRPIMWKTGHAHMRNKIKETGAPVGGEYSGHLFFNDRWYGFDDGLYAAARLLEIMSLREQSLDEIIETLPTAEATEEIRIAIADDDKFSVLNNLKDQANFEGANLITIDGLRVEYPFGWGLIRVSNTSPALTLRFEADSAEALEKIQAIFREQLQQYCPTLQLSF